MMPSRILTTAITTVLFAAATPSHATNGSTSHGFGSKNQSMAGSGVALPMDSLSGVLNPATIVHVEERMDLGLTVFSPQRGYIAGADGHPAAPSLSSGQYDSDKEAFPVPHFGYTRKLGADAAFAISAVGNGGMNTEYPNNVFSAFSPETTLNQLANLPNSVLGGMVNEAVAAGTISQQQAQGMQQLLQSTPGLTMGDLVRGMGQQPPFSNFNATTPVGIDLAQLMIGFTYSRKLSPMHSFGISPILAIQALKVYGLEPFRGNSVAPNHVTNNGRDFSYGGGIRIGWFSQLSKEFSFGAAYQSRLWMTAFDDYKGMLAEGGDLDIPSNFSIGLAYKASPKLTFAFDIQHIRYAEVASMGNKHNRPLVNCSNPLNYFTCVPVQALGSDDGLGFGWENQTIGKLGVQWEMSPDLTLRAGYSKAKAIIPESQVLFNIIAPATTTDHVTFGGTKKLDKNNEISFQFMYAPNAEVSGTNPNTATQTHKLYMKQYEIGVSWGMRF